MVVARSAGVAGHLDVDDLASLVLVVRDRRERERRGVGVDLKADGRVAARKNRHALDGRRERIDVDLDARVAGFGDEPLICREGALHAARDIGGVAGLEHDLRVGRADLDTRLRCHDTEGVIKGGRRNVQLKAALERRGLDVRVAHSKAKTVRGHERHLVVLDEHMNAREHGARLVGRGHAPHAADHLRKQLRRQLDGLLESIGRELGEVARVERVQLEGALLARDERLAILDFHMHRSIGEGLDDVVEDLAGHHDVALELYMGRNAMTDRDRVIRRLELKNTVLSLDEHTREDGEGRCRGDALHDRCECLREGALAHGELHVSLIPFYI